MSGIDFNAILQIVSILGIPVVFAITLHEVAHGWAAKQLGDPTAYKLGRLSLNPLKHVDPIGTVVVSAETGGVWDSPGSAVPAKPGADARQRLSKIKTEVLKSRHREYAFRP